MASIVYIVILIVSFLFLVRKSNDTESYFPLKIIGYFILGSFAFNFNQISLPLGFVVYLLLFRPKLNIQGKRMAAVFGVLAFLFAHWTIPYVIEEWESRPTFIEHQLSSVYTMNFQKEYELVKQELKLENNSLRLEDFKVDYTEDGRITDLSWQLLGQNGNGYNLYQIRYDISKNRYRVIYSQHDTWLQYNQLIEADLFFENLILLDIKDITHAKGDFFSYGIQSTGERISYAVGNQTHFVVSIGEIQLLDDEQLPVEGYCISTFAIKKTGEERDDQGNITQESFEGTESSDYLFDVNFGEE
ncbi:hypothetical protein [Neobacillus drentensis]|uniref:hypothetical protein n=1 Tax=Neobacillus drentensis TaxID=220684 RepID=UPI00286089D7|nr:hypothetical protein [Neobacillus drentensis]MDR7235942.1 hypothetical protein [Neobacillus drentensis]